MDLEDCGHWIGVDKRGTTLLLNSPFSDYLYIASCQYWVDLFLWIAILAIGGLYLLA